MMIIMSLYIEEFLFTKWSRCLFKATWCFSKSSNNISSSYYQKTQLVFIPSYIPKGTPWTLLCCIDPTHI